MATTNTHTEAPGGHAPAPFPPFQRDSFASQLIWLALAFVALYLLMSRVALPRVGGIIQERRARIEGDFAEAQRLRAQSEATVAEYEKGLAEARNRAQALAAENRDRLMAEAEQSRKALEGKLNAELAEAERTIQASKTAALSHVREVATDAAAAIVEKLIGAAPSAPAVEQAVERALKR